MLNNQATCIASTSNKDQKAHFERRLFRLGIDSGVVGLCITKESIVNNVDSTQELLKHSQHAHSVKMWDILRFYWRAWKYRWGNNRAEVEIILSTVKKGQNCIDIGAHKGAYTYWFSKAAGLTGHVDAFEPQPILAEQLRKVIHATNICNTEIHQIALSNISGTAKLAIPSLADCSPSAKLIGQQNLQQDKVIEVSTTTIDEFYHDHFARPISFIKCDAEGHELEIFEGGKKVIQQDRPVIMFECETRHHSLEKMMLTFDFLLSRDYRGFFFRNSELFPLEDFDPAVHQAADQKHTSNNFLFIPYRKGDRARE